MNEILGYIGLGLMLGLAGMVPASELQLLPMQLRVLSRRILRSHLLI